MTKLPRGVTGRKLLRALQRLGFEAVRVTGSHHYLRNPATGRATVVPAHGGKKAIPPGTLAAILRQAGVTSDELRGKL